MPLDKVHRMKDLDRSCRAGEASSQGSMKCQIWAMAWSWSADQRPVRLWSARRRTRESWWCWSTVLKACFWDFLVEADSCEAVKAL